MCVIVYKPRRVAMPGERLLARCWAKNPHGAGVAVMRDGQVTIDKGFMEFGAFMDFVNEGVTRKDAACFHFRIATSGGINPGACHPFPVSHKVADLKQLHCQTPVAFIHNGVISAGTKSLSDTMLYVKGQLARYVEGELAPRTRQRMIAADTIGSRTLLFDARANRAYMTGAWHHDEASGLWFSNTLFMNRPVWWPGRQRYLLAM